MPKLPSKKVTLWLFAQKSKWTLLSVAIKLFSNLAFNKIMALALGASGVTLFAHVMNLFNGLLAIPQEGTSKGLVKLLGNAKQQKEGIYLGMGILMNLLSFGLFGGYLLLNHHNFFTVFALGGSSFIWGCAFLIVTLGYLIHTFLLTLWQIKQDFQRYALLNTIGNLLALSILAISSRHYPDYILLTFPVGLGISVFFTIAFSWKTFRVSYAKPELKWDKAIFGEWFNFFLMAVSMLIFDRVVSFGVREYSILNFDSENTGYWQSVATISGYYSAAYISVAMAVYYPQVTKLVGDARALRQYVKSVGFALMPIIAIGLFLVFISRSWLTPLFFTDGFGLSESLYRFQLFGDFFRLTGFLLAYLLLAQGRIGAFVLVQALSAVSYLIVIPLVIDTWNLETFPLAHFVRSLISFGVLLFLLRKDLFAKIR